MNFIEEDWGVNPYTYIPSQLDAIDNPNHLYHAAKLCEKMVRWKTSVQRYELNLLSNITSTYYEIESGTYRPRAIFEFKLSERGHERDIKAHDIYDRVVQRSLNDYVLLPVVTPYLIYNNGASQKGKGLSFSRARFEEDLRSALFGMGPDCYILFIDFSKYFDNIVHEQILEMFKPLINPAEYAFLREVFKEFEIDVSYMDDEEYSQCIGNLFNSLEYSQNVSKDLQTGEKMMRKSVGIGSQTSQVSGIFYPTNIDVYCTAVKGYRYYGRYMDDTYIIAKTKEELVQLLKEVTVRAEQIGIHINQRKTKIVPLMSKFTYLKINYHFTSTGKLIREVPNEIFNRELVRIVKFKHLYDKKRLTLQDILQCFLSWYGTYYDYDSKNNMNGVELFFKKTFGLEEEPDLHLYLRKIFKEENRKMHDHILLDTI